jgi:hypothetical protein
VFDEAIKRFSIPLRYTSQVYECVGLDFDGTLLEGADGLVPEIDTVNNTVAIKGNLIFGPYIRPDNFIGTVFANMLFEARGSSATDSSISFDTMFIAPDIGYGLQDSNLLVILPEFVPRRLDVVTSVDDGVLPSNFVLDQNYPNPFNPSTTIAFTAPRAGHVTLTVYNLLGQRILTLADEVVSPGRYEFEWSGADERGKPVSSGIYFYHLSALDFSETRKMVLMK